MFKKVLFILLMAFSNNMVWTAEHVAPSEEQAFESKIEDKQQQLEQQQEQRTQAETDLREAQNQEQEIDQKLAEYGYVSWGVSKFWGGGYDALLQEKTATQDAQEIAQNKINDAQKQIEQIQKDIAQLSQEYTPEIPTQDLNVLQNKMNEALKNKDINSFNQNLQKAITKTPNVSDKFTIFTNAIEAVIQEYPTDLTAQVDALKKIELTLNLLLGNEYTSKAYQEAIGGIAKARENVQVKIDERSPWYSALRGKNISTFEQALGDLFWKKQTDEDKLFLLRDVFTQVSVNLDVGSKLWLDALDPVFRYGIGIPTEVEGVDFKTELLSSAIDEVNAKLKPGSIDWVEALNALWLYDKPGGEIQKRINDELKKEEIKTVTINLDDLLKKGELADYENGLDKSFSKLSSTDAQKTLIENQYSSIVAHYGTENYSEQMQVLFILKFNVVSLNQVEFQGFYNKINDRLEVITNRFDLGNNSLGDTLKNAPGDITRSRILEEELFAAQQLHKDVSEDPKAGYEDQKSFLTDVQQRIDQYKGGLYDVVRNDISTRLNEIAQFNPQKPSTFINDLDKELNFWNKLPDDQINDLKQKYNEGIDQLITALEQNDTVNVKNAQERFTEIKDLIDKYGLAQYQDGFAKNVDAVLDFSSKVFEEYKPVELTPEEKNVLTKLTAGQTINPDEAALLAGIGAKKVLSFIATNLTPENLASADKVAGILEKSTQIANIAGKVMKGIDTALGAADNWYVKVLLAGPTLVAAPLAKRFLTAQYGEHTVAAIENVIKIVPDKVSNLVAVTNSETFKGSAAALTTGGKVIKSISNLLNGVAQNIHAAADAKKIENIPHKEVLPTYDAVSAIARRLDELANLEPRLVVEPESVPAQKKGFFAQIQDYFSTFVADVKNWISSLFSGDTGIPSLEKKFNAAQEAYKNDPTSANAQALVVATQNLHTAYQEVMGSIASYKELRDLWNNAMMDSDIATALEKDPTAITIDVLDQIATVVMQSKSYNAAFMNAMAEITSAVNAASQGTALQDAYEPLLNKLVVTDYATKLQNDKKNIEALNNAYIEYKTNLQDTIAKAKQPITPSAPDKEDQTGILGNGL